MTLPSQTVVSLYSTNLAPVASLAGVSSAPVKQPVAAQFLRAVRDEYLEGGGLRLAVFGSIPNICHDLGNASRT